MNTHIDIVLDTRRKKKVGSFPINLRLTHFRKVTSIKTGYSVHKSDWDEGKRQIRKSYSASDHVARLNNLILRKKVHIQDIINDLNDSRELNSISLTQLKRRVTNSNQFESFFNFGEHLVDELKQNNQIGTARAYVCLLGILKTFNKGKDLSFQEIDYDFIRSLESYHLSKEGNSINGLSTYLRTLRAIYNKAILRGVIKKDLSPFTNYKIRSAPTQKRAINLKTIKKILELQLENTNKLFNYRNYFLLSYMLYGISFTDMAYLTMSNIVNSRVQFKRRKTGKYFDILISEQAKVLLDDYILNKAADDYIFPIIKRKSAELQYKDIEWERKRYNKGLKKIAAMCGIQEKLTSYVSRHTFATQAMMQEIPLQAISAMMGHSKLNTTQIYLKGLPDSILDTYNKKISTSLIE